MPRLKRYADLSSLPEHSLTARAKHTTLRQELSSIESAAASTQFADVTCGTLGKTSLPMPVGDRSCRNHGDSRSTSNRSNRQVPDPIPSASSFVCRASSDPSSDPSSPVPSASSFVCGASSSRSMSHGSSGRYARKALAGASFQNPADEHSICSAWQNKGTKPTSRIENTADDTSSCSGTTPRLPSSPPAQSNRALNISPVSPRYASKEGISRAQKASCHDRPGPIYGAWSLGGHGTWADSSQKSSRHTTREASDPGAGTRVQSLRPDQIIHTGELANLLRPQNVPVASTPAGPSRKSAAEAAESTTREVVQEAARAQTFPSVTSNTSAMMPAAGFPASLMGEVLDEAVQPLPADPPSPGALMAKLLMSGERLQEDTNSPPATARVQLRRKNTRRLTAKISTLVAEVGQSSHKPTSKTEEAQFEDFGAGDEPLTKEEAYWQTLWELGKQQRLQLSEHDASACLMTLPHEPQTHADQSTASYFGLSFSGRRRSSLFSKRRQ